MVSTSPWKESKAVLCTEETMTYLLTIPGRLPGLNELISNRGRPWWACRTTKQKAMKEVMWHFQAAKIPPFVTPIRMKINWIEKNERRDRDNVVGGGMKILLDSIKTLSIIVNDSRKWVLDPINDTTQIDKRRPRVEIEIIEVKKK
jgi:hypothetical protein